MMSRSPPQHVAARAAYSEAAASWAAASYSWLCTVTDVTRKINHAMVVSLQDVTKVCAALEANTTLRELSASGRPMSPETAAVVSAMLSRNSTLTSLSMGDGRFGDAGIIALCPGLAVTATLRQLDLEAKGITEAGASRCSGLLQIGVRLKRLSRCLINFSTV